MNILKYGDRSPAQDEAHCHLFIGGECRVRIVLTNVPRPLFSGEKRPTSFGIGLSAIQNYVSTMDGSVNAGLNEAGHWEVDIRDLKLS